MKEAALYTKLKKNVVKCHTCGYECVIAKGKKGFCQTRLNENGKLYSLIYGKITGGIQIDPIEKKPMYHFFPGTMVASIGSMGCNFRCKQCLNYFTSYEYDFSHLEDEITITPKEFINEVKKLNVSCVAFTYNEPTIWIEFVHEAAKLAKKENLYTVFVTNGYLTEESLDYIGPYMRGYAVDFKGFSNISYKKQDNEVDFQKIIELTKRAQEKWRMKVEITTLIIPGINDSVSELKKMSKWIRDNLGSNTPWHLSQYSPELAPDAEFREIATTSKAILGKASQIGKTAGLNFVFVWAPSSNFSISDTVCPNCQKMVIKRSGWNVSSPNFNPAGKCSFCGYDLDIIIS